MFSWTFLLERILLSALREVYPWMPEHRDHNEEMFLPTEVKRELALAATLGPLAAADLALPWHTAAYMYDASTYGGRVLCTEATPQES